MAMVCPKCKGTYEQRIHCPTCHVHLNYQEKGRRGYQGGPWQQTPWGRIVLGLALAQGLFYGLRQLFTAGALASGNQEKMWTTLGGLLLLQGLQLLALLIGGMMAGASQKRGIVYGAILGIWNGALCLMIYPEHSANILISSYGQPILQMVFGALGGFLGSFIWRPLSEPATAHSHKPEPEDKKKKKFRAISLWVGPLFWGRVITGSAFAIGGTLWADAILEFVEDAGGSEVRISTHLQAQLLTWEITAFALLGGACLAGATTFNGLKQGLAVGILTTIVLVGFKLGQGEATPLIFLLTAVSPIILGMLGGVFGSQLLPPLMNKERKALWDVP